MKIVDSHFHWWPRSIFDELTTRKDFPRCASNGKNGYTYWRKEGANARFNLGAEWFDLDRQFAHMQTLGFEVDVVCSTGPFSVHFCDLPVAEGKDACMRWNQEMSDAQKEYAGHLWATAVLPFQDTQAALDTLEYAVAHQNLMGVNIPGSIGSVENIDAERLEPIYARIEALGLPIFVHPTDAMFTDILDGYNGALYKSLGRVIDVSVSAYRLVLSGIMERYPNLKVVMSHTGGALPYQSGRMDKNSKDANLPLPPSTYLKRMYTDTVSPHKEGMKFAIEYYGVDHIMYGSDYPCWDPATALKLLHEVGLSDADCEKILNSNARSILGLKMPELALA
jgi:aminocarboxymuconate-semialdehyde decarboxylase